MNHPSSLLVSVERSAGQDRFAELVKRLRPGRGVGIGKRVDAIDDDARRAAEPGLLRILNGFDKMVLDPISAYSTTSAIKVAADLTPAWAVIDYESPGWERCDAR